MAILKPFRGIRPPKQIVKQLASRPYDVMNSKEAKLEADKNPYSLLHIIHSEIDLPEDIDEHDARVYQKAKENYTDFQSKGWLVSDSKDCLYIYAQTMNQRTQYGLVGCAGVEDYMTQIIKKHELTRRDKEEDRMNHVRITNANVEPVFFVYKSNLELDSIINSFVKENSTEYDFVSDDGVGHEFWIISDDDLIQKIVHLFSEIPFTYIADGHHRTAAAALVGNEKKQSNPNHRGNEEYNYFLAVHFPDNQLSIFDYNRVVKDLNDLSVDKFLDLLKLDFDIKNCGREIYKPKELHELSMYLDKNWYSLKAHKNLYNDNDPIGVLDVTILSTHILDKILNIKDLRTDKRVDFVGGIRGLSELQMRVDNQEMKVAFALYPVSMKQLIDIADSNQIMPPKTTWFEPKLRSGLVIHSLEN